VLAGVVQHISQRPPELRALHDGEREVAVGEDVADSATPEAIERLRDADHQALHAAGELAAVVGLDDQVQVVLLDAELDQAEAGLGLAGAEGALEDSVGLRRAQPRQPVADPEHDVRGAADVGASDVRNLRASASPRRSVVSNALRGLRSSALSC